MADFLALLEVFRIIICKVFYDTVSIKIQSKKGLKYWVKKFQNIFCVFGLEMGMRSKYPEKSSKIFSKVGTLKILVPVYNCISIR